MSYTFFRAGLGAVLLLPVTGGFTVAQVIVLQSLVWGSALGDAMRQELIAGHVLMGT